MTSHDDSVFFKVGVAVCLFGALTPLIDLVLPADGGAADIVGDLVSTFALYLYVGLAFGLTVLRAGPLPKVAAVLLLVDVLGPSFVAILGVPHGSEVLLGVHVAAVLALVAALVRKPSLLPMGLAAVAVAGAGLIAWMGTAGGLEGSLGLAATGFGLAGLCHLGVRAEWRTSGQGDSAAWRRAELGLRVFMLGELGRILLFALAMVVGLASRAAEDSEAASWIVMLGQTAIIAMATIGLFSMRDAPAGRVWVVVGLGLGLVALGSVLFELLAMLLGLDSSFTGMPVTGRQVTHLCLGATTALALGALGQRAGLQTASEDGRSIARAYLWLFVVTYTTLLVRDLDGPKGLLGLLGLVFIVGMVVSVRRIRALGLAVRQALPGGAAVEAFGGDELAPRGEARQR